MFKKKTNNYVSDLDKFLEEKRRETPLSKSQQKEIAKHQNIADKRDHPHKEDDSNIWEEF